MPKPTEKPKIVVNPASNRVKIKWGYTIIFFILFLIGATLILLNNALTALAITVGVIVAAVGIFYGIIVLSKKERGVTFAFKIIFSSMMIICGIVAVIFNARAVSVIVAVSALLLIIDASFKMHTAAMSKRYDDHFWWIILCLSVATASGAFFLLKYPPADNMRLCSIWLGILFLLDAVSNLLSTIFVTMYERRQKLENYYEFYSEEIAPREAQRISDGNGSSIEDTQEPESLNNGDQSDPQAVQETANTEDSQPNISEQDPDSETPVSNNTPPSTSDADQ